MSTYVISIEETVHTLKSRGIVTMTSIENADNLL